jgi:hypothetical protein
MKQTTRMGNSYFHSKLEAKKNASIDTIADIKCKIQMNKAELQTSTNHNRTCK